MWTIYIVTAELMVVTLFTIGNIFVQHKQIKEAHIVIIGAGPSGIAAASKLLENGVDDIVILEAENRVGGRVNTIKFGDAVIDLGGQWIHGEEGNVAFEMASEHNLMMETVLEKYRERNAFIEESGSVIDISISNKFLKIFNEIIQSAESDLGNYTGSLGEYFELMYPKKLEEYSLTDTRVAQLFFYYLEKIQDITDASNSWYESSGRGMTMYKVCKGKNWAWKNGYRTVLDLLMKKIPDPSKELPVLSKTKLNSEVTKIIWDNLPGEKSNKIRVECADGSIYLADQVIVTVSLGVLKERANSMFSPALSTKKLNAIEGLSIGTVDKIYLKFPYKWWPENYVTFLLLRPDYNYTCTTKDCWMKNVFIFHEVDNQPLVLCGWTVGSVARVMEQLPVDDVKQETVKLLNEFVGKAFNISVPEPDIIIRTTWYSNPHFRGSYSYRSVKSEAMGVSAADLAEPILNSEGLPVVMFAGEATHSSYYSTVHGAIETGRREAERILKTSQKPMPV